MKTTKSLSLVSALCLLAISLTGCAAGQSTSMETQDAAAISIEVADGWIKSSDMSAAAGGMTAAFGVFTNNSDEDITLIGGSTDVAGKVEIHEVVMVDDEMKMQPIAGGIVIPAGESVTLEPGGLHVMLMELTRGLELGEEIELTLKFDGHPDLKLVLPVRTSLSGEEEYNSEEGSMEEDHSDHDH